MTDESFDFAAFQSACAGRDAAACLGFYAADAEWIEYRHDPPSCTRRVQGRSAIGLLLGAEDLPALLSLEPPETELDRIRFRARSPATGLRRVMLATGGGLIRRQVALEARD